MSLEDMLEDFKKKLEEREPCRIEVTEEATRIIGTKAEVYALFGCLVEHLTHDIDAPFTEKEIRRVVDLALMNKEDREKECGKRKEEIKDILKELSKIVKSIEKDDE